MIRPASKQEGLLPFYANLEAFRLCAMGAEPTKAETSAKGPQGVRIREAKDSGSIAANCGFLFCRRQEKS